MVSYKALNTIKAIVKYAQPSIIIACNESAIGLNHAMQIFSMLERLLTLRP